VTDASTTTGILAACDAGCQERRLVARCLRVAIHRSLGYRPRCWLLEILVSLDRHEVSSAVRALSSSAIRELSGEVEAAGDTE
jgi:hypothetical protein